ncbi:hypothetical protein EIP91_006889 [Steccherinum ochraceum]|uniref:NACHT domain-containing protein n=1 Tax=Steccherinum ochraceum TaxID=92696 RepID=A0A4R0R7H9_9APHY|nr:hypothetical protein EIP91_006889 [Steccherinum ochraceum]
MSTVVDHHQFRSADSDFSSCSKLFAVNLGPPISFWMRPGGRRAALIPARSFLVEDREGSVVMMSGLASFQCDRRRLNTTATILGAADDEKREDVGHSDIMTPQLVVAAVRVQITKVSTTIGHASTSKEKVIKFFLVEGTSLLSDSATSILIPLSLASVLSDLITPPAGATLVPPAISTHLLAASSTVSIPLPIGRTPSHLVLPHVSHPVGTTTDAASPSQTQVASPHAPAQDNTATSATDARPSTTSAPSTVESFEGAWKKASDAVVGFAKITGRGVDTALPLVAASVDTFPIAKGVVAGLIAVIEIAKIDVFFRQRVRDNKEKLEQTQERLERLDEMIQRAGVQIRKDWEDHGIRLAEVLRQLVDMKQQGKVKAVLSSKHDQEAVLDCVKDINDIFHDFNFQLQLRIFDSVAKAEEILEDQGRAQDRIVKQTANTERTVMDEGARTQLERLKHSADAAYGKGRQGRKRTSCLENTRVRILNQLDAWLLHPQDYRIFWLNGMAGTGKSTIADSLYQAAERHGAYVAAFFCSRDLDSTRDILRVIPSLAFQLAIRHEAYRAALVTSLKSEDYPENFALKDQIEKLVLKPLTSVSESGSSLVFLLIDALDECQGDGVRDNVRTFVNLLLSHADDLRRAGVKFFLSSRPAHEISGHFKMDELHRQHERLVLHDADFVDVQSDLEVYVRHELQEIRKTDPSFTFTPAQLTQISKASVPLFIFAVTVCAHIGGRGANSTGRINHAKRLKQILTQISANSAGEGNQTMKGLDGLYHMILEDAFKAVSEEADEFDDEDREEQGKFVLTSILIFFEPLGLAAMSTLLGSTYDRQKVKDLLYHLYAVIAVPDDDVQPVRALHASLYDYLTSPKRAPPFLIDPSVDHGTLAASCLELMLDMLTHDNICGLKIGDDQDIADLPSHIQDSRIRDALPAVQYACKHWSQHLVATATPNSRLLEVLDCFASTCLLRWIEALVVFKELKSAIDMISSARTWLNGSDMRHPAPNTASLLSDLERMAFEFHDAIVASPIQVYISAFPFLPRKCTLYLKYCVNIDSSLQVLDIITGVDDTWSPILGTVIVPSSENINIDAFCVSPRSRTVACFGTRWTDTSGRFLLFWDSVVGGAMDVLRDERLKNVSLVFHLEHRLFGVSRSPRPIVWSIDMDFKLLKNVALDLERVREIVEENHDSDGVYEHFSKTLSFSSDGSRLAGLMLKRCYLLTWVLKQGAEKEGDASDRSAFVLEHCLQLTGLPPPRTSGIYRTSTDDSEDHMSIYAVGTQLQWSPDSSTIAITTRSRALLCTLPRDHHSKCSLSPIESGVGSLECLQTVWAEGSEYLACRSSSALTVYAVSKATTSAYKATEIWTKLLDRDDLVSIAFAPDGQFIIAGHRTGLVSVHAVKDSAFVSKLRVTNRSVEGVVYSSDGSRIICRTSFPDTVVVLNVDDFVKAQDWDQASHKQVRETCHCRALQYSPSLSTLSAVYTESGKPRPPWVWVWDAAQGHRVASIAINDILDSQLRDDIAVMYTHDGKELLAVVPGHAYRYDLDVCRRAHVPLDLTPKVTLRPLETMKFVSMAFAVSPKYDFIFFLQCDQMLGTDSVLRSELFASIYEMASGKVIQSYPANAVLSFIANVWRPEVAWSARGDLIACAHSDSSVTLWCFSELQQPRTHPRSVRISFVDPADRDRNLLRFSFSPSGEELLVCFVRQSGSVFIRSWDVSSGEFLRRVELSTLECLRPRIYTPRSGGMLVHTRQGTFKAEELLSMGESSSLPNPYDSPHSRYQFERYGDGWLRDYRGRKVFRLPQSFRTREKSVSYGNLLASVSTDSLNDRRILMVRTRHGPATDPKLRDEQRAYARAPKDQLTFHSIVASFPPDPVLFELRGTSSNVRRMGSVVS